MATSADQLDELIATTFDNVSGVLADQITTETPLLAALDSRSAVKKDGGKRIVKQVLYAFNDTVGSYDGYDLFDTTPQDGFGEAVYEWKQYVGTVTIDGRTLRLNSGSPRIIDILAGKIEQLRVSIEEDLGTMLWGDGTGNSSKDFLGLAAIVAASGTLGGIDPSTETWWKSGTASGVDLTTLDGVSDLNTVVNARRIAKSKPDFGFTTEAVYSAYEALVLPQLRFTDNAMADLGFDNLKHKGVTLMFDNDAPSAKLFYINTKYLEFVQHSDCWMTRGPFREPVNQDAKTMPVLSMGELVTDVRRAHAVVSSIVVP
jgi:hypothetical protein